MNEQERFERGMAQVAVAEAMEEQLTDAGRGDWAETFSGGRFYAGDPRAEEIVPEDLAHHLARVCRFGGAVRCEGIYSVAQHCVLVSRMLPRELALWGLLHDAAEAYIGDMQTPVKRRRDMLEYRWLERGIMESVWERFREHLHGMTFEELDGHPLVKQADLVMLWTERRDVMRSDMPWPNVEPAVMLPHQLRVWSITESESQYLTRLRNLTR